MQANFIESNPDLQSRTRHDGQIEEVYRLPLVPMRRTLAQSWRRWPPKLDCCKRKRRRTEDLAVLPPSSEGGMCSPGG